MNNHPAKDIIDLLIVERHIKMVKASNDDFLEIPKCLEPLLKDIPFLTLKNGRYYCLGYFINIVKD